MSKAARTFCSSVDRPLNVRKRADLVINKQQYLGRDYWVVKDPLNLKYYRFEEEEFTLLDLLDGETSLSELQKTFESRFAPQRISFVELHRYLATLNRSCLVVSSGIGQGDILLNRADEAARRRRWGTLANLLSVRLRGFDPDRFLTRLNDLCGWLFSIPSLVLGVLLMAIAGLLIGVHFETFQAKLPTFQDFFAAQNWLWLAVTLAITKVIHELGHGLACKRLGGECNEMGVMFLVFTPCLYCNVSDAWMLPNKWHRAAIAAAGMYVELVLAAICTIVWWFTLPGMLNYLCLNVVFVSSVSTIIFNANPLMRYDGYYILSDLIEIPNLRQKANTVVQRKLGAWFAGLPEVDDPFLPARRRLAFASFAIASSVYRWIVVFSIFWFVYRMLEPYGLKIVGQLLACSALYSLFIAPLVQLVRFFQAPGRLRKVKPTRVALTAAILVSSVAAIMLWPLPYRVECPVFIQPRHAEAVYVDVDGTLLTIHRRPGEQVTEGELLMTLENEEMIRRQIQLVSQYNIEHQRARAARIQEQRSPEVDAQSARFEQAALSLHAQATSQLENIAKLEIRAPRSGIWWPPAHRFRQSTDATGELGNWDGLPTDAKNIGAYLEAGTELGRIGEVDEQEAILAVDQEVAESLRGELTVDILVPQLGSRLITTSIERIGRKEMSDIPQALAGQFGGSIPSRVGEQGELVPLSPTFPVVCELPPQKEWVAQGAVGRARIHMGTRTIGWRLGRWAMRTFNFEL